MHVIEDEGQKNRGHNVSSVSVIPFSGQNALQTTTEQNRSKKEHSSSNGVEKINSLCSFGRIKTGYFGKSSFILSTLCVAVFLYRFPPHWLTLFNTTTCLYSVLMWFNIGWHICLCDVQMISLLPLNCCHIKQWSTTFSRHLPAAVCALLRKAEVTLRQQCFCQANMQIG